MANELTLNLSVNYRKNAVSMSMTSGSVGITVTGDDYIRGTYTATTSSTAIPLGSVTSPGYCTITNKDASNYVEILDAVAGNVCIRVLPGDWAVFRFTTTAPAIKAHTASCKVEYMIIAN